MSRNKELIERIEKIRKMQEKAKQGARSAASQADELDEILAVSRAEHSGLDNQGRPLRSASELMGGRSRGGSARFDAESAYSRNFASAHCASPDAFSRNKTKRPTTIAPNCAPHAMPPGPARIAPKNETPGPRAKGESDSALSAAEASGAPQRSAKTATSTEMTEESTLIVRRRKPYEEGRRQGFLDSPEDAPTRTLARTPAAAPQKRSQDDIDTSPGPMENIDPSAETRVLSVGRERQAPAEEPSFPSRITTTERTEVIRRRRLHPDSVDPETGEPLPTDHVSTAPGLAGLSGSVSERTQPRITPRPTRPQEHLNAETQPIDPRIREKVEETLIVRRRKPPREPAPRGSGISRAVELLRDSERRDDSDGEA